jgi:hypothetical protein
MTTAGTNYFSFAGIVPGIYKVDITSKGFKVLSKTTS